MCAHARRARHFRDLGDPDSDVSKLVADRGGFDLMPEMNTKPVNKYLPPRLKDQLDPERNETHALEAQAENPQGSLRGLIAHWRSYNASSTLRYSVHIAVWTWVWAVVLSWFGHACLYWVGGICVLCNRLCLCRGD